MTHSDAVETLNHYGKERKKAYSRNMDWVPNARTMREIREAAEVVSKSKQPAPRLLNKAGYALFEKIIEIQEERMNQ